MRKFGQVARETAEMAAAAADGDRGARPPTFKGDSKKTQAPYARRTSKLPSAGDL
jgi:hypothetical protein